MQNKQSFFNPTHVMSDKADEFSTLEENLMVSKKLRDIFKRNEPSKKTKAIQEAAEILHPTMHNDLSRKTLALFLNFSTPASDIDKHIRMLEHKYEASRTSFFGHLNAAFTVQGGSFGFQR